MGVKLVDDDFLNVGTDDPDDEDCVGCLNCVLDDFLDADPVLGPLPLPFVPPLLGSAVSACPLMERKAP